MWSPFRLERGTTHLPLGAKGNILTKIEYKDVAYDTVDGRNPEPPDMYETL